MDNIIGAEVWMVYFDPADLDDLNAVFSSREKALNYVDDECDRLKDIWFNPEITFEKTTHQFGEIPYGGNGTYEFVFKNTGNEPLILSQPKSSCGCTVPEWPKRPILPGDTDVIKVTYKNTDRPGSFSKYVTIFSNAKTNKSFSIL